MKDTLIGRSAKIAANSFIDSEIAAHIVLVDDTEKKIVLKLDVALNVDGTFYTHAIASPRLERDELIQLSVNGVLGCTVTWIPETQFDVMRPLDVSWWRGGAAAITDVYLQ